jgi:hypothetical protein
MNITTGGPHILLFERDQQLVALLTSELQLAGYECHTARTAVEVFDAIARYPVRLVLVDLAQAAAARREFWVALDTQRRGRGVQVFTFHCTNIAGYGPATEDPDDRSHTELADMEVDGMLGIMNMVNAIRSRIAVSNTGTMSRTASNVHPVSPVGAQVTVPIPSVPPFDLADRQVDAQASLQGRISRPTNMSGSAIPAEVPPTPSTPGTAAPYHTDKIRAVIYPNQRSWSTTRDVGTTGEGTADTFASGQGGGGRTINETTLPKESGLAQLSRMLQEHRTPILEEMAQGRADEQISRFQDEVTSQQRTVRPADVVPNAPPDASAVTPSLLSGQALSATKDLSAMSLRASPIQDMPTDRISGPAGQSDTSSHTSVRRPDESSQFNYAQASASPTLVSISTPTPTVQGAPTKAKASPPTPHHPSVSPVGRDSQHVGREKEVYNNTRFTISAEASEPYIEAKELDNVVIPSLLSGQALSETKDLKQDDDDNESTVGRRSSQALVPEETIMSEITVQSASDHALLLDIMQSLPPMSSPPPQPQVHNGRATRSLGRVLLEGHLVPQNRLEVAQSIQRMLRGVDLNYQLGEILLMFKLLTPDQLLAASLVSYGLITTAQISALGRIRQELHSIGLEYDLENLLILFRMLTSEQLREVRTGWTG